VGVAFVVVPVPASRPVVGGPPEDREGDGRPERGQEGRDRRVQRPGLNLSVARPPSSWLRPRGSWISRRKLPAMTTTQARDIPHPTMSSGRMSRNVPKRIDQVRNARPRPHSAAFWLSFHQAAVSRAMSAMATPAMRSPIGWEPRTPMSAVLTRARISIVNATPSATGFMARPKGFQRRFKGGIFSGPRGVVGTGWTSAASMCGRVGVARVVQRGDSVTTGRGRSRRSSW
jgi:hypothetical protein